MTSYQTDQEDDSGKLVASKIGQLANLQAGEAVVLNDIDPTLHKAIVAVGWQAPEIDKGFPVDIDVSAFLLKQDKTVTKDEDFIFYNNLSAEGGAITHKGDVTDTENKTGDHEAIEIDLDNLPFGIDRIAFSVTLHNADDRQQTFGLIKQAYIRIVNPDTGTELAHYDLTMDAAEFTGIIFGELMREGLGWKFHAIGKGVQGGLFKIAHDYAVNVAPM